MVREKIYFDAQCKKNTHMISGFWRRRIPSNIANANYDNISNSNDEIFNKPDSDGVA